MPSYNLVSRECKSDNTIIKIGNTMIGNGETVIIAGPCAVENRDLMLTLAPVLKGMGVQMLRGGAYKPRTSPYSFQGLGKEGLFILQEASHAAGLPVITELLDVRDYEIVYQYADVIQIGSRNMQNYGLLQEVGRSDKPVLLKRGLSATIEEWLLAAEYIMAAGNSQVILCERGIRTFESYTRNTLDINAVAAVKQLSHLPVIVDPSHATGRRELVAPTAKAAVAAGADGLMIEVHPDPGKALSDGQQSLYPDQLARLIKNIRAMEKALKNQ
ncbi:3-deoxy-7-phosphoheptulonate synthase [Peptococcaceae bacterium 1198_IL3148]